MGKLQINKRSITWTWRGRRYICNGETVKYQYRTKTLEWVKDDDVFSHSSELLVNMINDMYKKLMEKGK